jgi:imidazolonepropionase-like amidohydrolase
MEVRKNKRKVKIHASKGHVAAKIMIDLQVEVDEYALDHLDEEKKVKALTKNIEDELRALAKKTLAKMQKANNDALGLGERVKAYHHSTWKQIDWDKVYPEMTIDPIFHVEIVRHGIIN